MLLVGAATMVTDLAPEKRRGEALSLYSLGLWGGLALGPLLGELVLDGDRFDAVWLLAAGFCLVAAAHRAHAARRPRRRESPAELAVSRLVHPAAVGPGLVLAVTVFGFAGLGTFARPLRARARPRRRRRRLPRLLGRHRRDAHRRTADPRPARPEANLGHGAPPASLPACSTIGLWNVPAGLFVGTVVLAFGQALAFPALMTLAVNGAPASERSSVVGTFTAFTELGFAVGALSLGAIASAVGYDGVFIVCAIGPLARRAPPRAHRRTARRRPRWTRPLGSRDGAARARAERHLRHADHPRLRQLRRRRLRARVLRPGHPARRGAADHGRGLGARHHDVRHRRRVRRRAERDVDRRVARDEGLGSARRDRRRNEDVQPHGRR